MPCIELTLVCTNITHFLSFTINTREYNSRCYVLSAQPRLVEQARKKKARSRKKAAEYVMTWHPATKKALRSTFSRNPIM